MSTREAATNKTICPHFCRDCFALRACPMHAISANSDSIEVNLNLCIACGICKTICVAWGYKALEKCRLKGL
uniref:4Fe-4S ferredoxin-type domain-containing protein n=1 Tax=Desulfobacca acetoxidans TaxID=60893 RepID=A0A7C5EMI7_9BACT